MRITALTPVLLGLGLVLVPATLSAQIQLTTVVSGLSSPVFVGNAGDNLNRLFIVELAGIVRSSSPPR